MNIDKEKNNNESLLNIYYQQKQKYQQIYASNKLHFMQIPMDYESKPLWQNKKCTKYFGSNRLINIDDYEKLTNINKNNLRELEKIQHKPQKYEDSSISATDSLSFIQDEQYSIKFMDSMLWQELLKQQEEIFQPLDFEDFLITSLTNQSETFENFDILIDEGYYSQLYQGFCLKNKESIAIKIQCYKILQLVENQFSYSLQLEIYNLYPKQFLRINLPVYVQQYVPDYIEIISKYELGQINLYKYCLQKKIDENEIKMIYHQVLQQILLLHKHNIAHRDIKPQNIIFVENKGWLLCDFEFSMKYQNLITICEIKGTKSFLPPYLYQISNIQGVEAKQDLFYNDQYALGITLIVVKNQIQTSNNLQDFLLRESDPNILFLLKESQKDKLYQQYINDEYSFLNPQIMPIIKQFSIKLETYQLIQVIKTLQQFGKNNQPLRDQLIKIIDENLENGREDYLFLNFQIYENLTIYLTQFKNIINLQTLKSSKFWILALQQENQQLELSVLKFMQNLGLQELLLKLGKQYLNKKYSIAVHVLMIKMLFFLKEDNQVYEEFKQMLRIKEFQYMSSIEQSEFISFTIQSFHWNLIDEKDIQYIEQYYYDKNFKIDDQVIDLYKNEKDAEESFLNYICDQQNQQDKPQAIFDHFKDFIVKFGSNQLNLCSNHCLKLYHLAFQTIDLKDLVILDKLLLNQVKFFSSIIQYQQLLKQSMYLQFLYTQNRLIMCDREKVRKSINSLFMFQQESQQQQNILNIIKQSSTLIYGIKNPRKIFQMIKRVSDMCNQFDGLKFNLYKIVFLDQVNQILYDSRVNYTHSRFWYKISQWQTKKINLVNKQIEYTEVVRHYDNMINYWISVRNQKRHDELVLQFRNPSERKMLKQIYEYKFAQIHYDITILIKLKENERLMNIFLQTQNLYR